MGIKCYKHNINTSNANGSKIIIGIVHIAIMKASNK